jgi:arginine deiminase
VFYHTLRIPVRPKRVETPLVQNVATLLLRNAELQNRRIHAVSYMNEHHDVVEAVPHEGSLPRQYRTPSYLFHPCTVRYFQREQIPETEGGISLMSLIDMGFRSPQVIYLC